MVKVIDLKEISETQPHALQGESTDYKSAVAEIIVNSRQHTSSREKKLSFPAGLI